MLVYGTEAVIPAEVEIPSLRVIQEVELNDAEWIMSLYDQLALIDGKRMNAVCHGQLYQNRMSRAFKKRVKPRQFALGQLVLKKIFPHQDEAKGKFSPNWQGTFDITVAFTKHVYTKIIHYLSAHQTSNTSLTKKYTTLT
ncbi:uncharacterized protein [Nicotiana sylvestris]|uniref:uncharacterized protein n=1 Tax=Nicotiana sylvestris TaxID=4096 RepID=UPI00388C8F7F